MVMERNKKLFWVVVLYLSQGFPFGVITATLPVYFRKHGFSLESIGFLTILTLPWSLKFLWAPVVDRHFQRKQWIVAMQIVMAAILFSLPTVSTEALTDQLRWLLLGLSFASATADIAIDAYFIEILGRDEIPSGNAVRIISWKGAYMFATGVVGFAATRLGWGVAFSGCALFLLGLVPLTLAAPPPLPEIPGEKAAAPSSSWLEGYASFFRRGGIVFILLFILTYKLGTSTAAPMIRPFWIDRGYSEAETLLVTGTVGTIESFIAPLAAAWVITRIGLFHSIWVFGLLQVIPMVLYGAIGLWDLGRPWIYAASLSESFDLSLAQVAFTSFLTLICDKRHAATQYAFLTSIFGLTRAVAGWSGSFGAQSWGYPPFFLLAFALGLVSFLFLPWVRRWTDGAGREGRPTPS
jgi:PAT family beta-lactamase induction signal transducer AmpG